MILFQVFIISIIKIKFGPRIELINLFLTEFTFRLNYKD